MGVAGTDQWGEEVGVIVNGYSDYPGWGKLSGISMITMYMYQNPQNYKSY